MAEAAHEQRSRRSREILENALRLAGGERGLMASAKEHLERRNGALRANRARKAA